MDVQQMLAEARQTAEVISDTLVPLIDDLSSVHIGQHSNYEVIQRSIIRRQHDSLDAVIGLVDAKKGELAVSLLRPGAEELMWLAYFNKIGARNADKLCEFMMLSDIFRTLQAQASYTPEHMDELGLGSWLEVSAKVQPTIISSLRQLGRELDWPKAKNSHTVVPSLRYIASQVNHLRLYEFLYFATSKTVHFNAHELTRRVWGKPPNYNWDAPLFRDFWSLFSLVWASRLLVLSCLECKDLIAQAPDVSHDGFTAALDSLYKYAYIPIITSREFMHSDHPKFSEAMEHLARRKAG